MASPSSIREVHYRTARPAMGHFPGHHRSTRGQSGFEFRGHASLLDAPDPRRLDLFASLRDPFNDAGNWWVKVYSQRLSIPVQVVADLSASMGFDGQRRKLDVLADLTESLAWSAWRTGDAFGFIGCDTTVRGDWLQPPTRSRGVGAPLAQRLRTLQPQGQNARGLLDAHRHLGRQRALLFLVSDFHGPLDEIARVIDSLSTQELVPVVLWDPLEFALGERPGLAWLRDPESGQRRLVWWRAALRERWLAHHAARRQALTALFRRHRLRPLFIEQGFDAEAMTRHFHA
jgi:Mg-chelatase subunit ChlD